MPDVAPPPPSPSAASVTCWSPSRTRRWIDSEVGGDKFDVVYPSLSIEASAPVAIVNKVVDKKGSRKQATAYLNFLYSPEGQGDHRESTTSARATRRVARSTRPASRRSAPSRKEKFGSWDAVQKTHFADGGVYDQITVKR